MVFCCFIIDDVRKCALSLLGWQLVFVHFLAESYFTFSFYFCECDYEKKIVRWGLVNVICSSINLIELSNFSTGNFLFHMPFSIL